MFLLTWVGAMVYWRVGHLEEKWGSRLRAENDAIIGGAEHAMDDSAAESWSF
jgi:hypothetical protein